MYLLECSALILAAVTASAFAWGAHAGVVEKRETKIIQQGRWDYGTHGDVLFTDGLSDCTGIAIAGSYAVPEPGQKVKFEAHVYAGESRRPYKTFEKNVKAAVRGGFRLEQVMVVYADPGSLLTTSSLRLVSTAERVDEARHRDAWNRDLFEKVEALAQGVRIQYLSHSVDRPWRLMINGENQILHGWSGRST